MVLTHELRESSGLCWVLEKLSPLSPFGKTAARSPRWFGPGEEAALEEELTNVERGLTLLAENGDALRAVTRCMPLYHDIHGCLDRDPGNPFDLVELFEVKHFLFTLEQMAAGYAALPLHFDHVAFPDLRPALDLLDPDLRRLPSFSITDGMHPGLAPLRAEKKALEREIRGADEAAKPALLDRRRILAVREDHLELEVRRGLTTRLMTYRSSFYASMDAIAHLDLILAKARLARRYRCVRPTLSTQCALSVRGLRHPQVAEELEGRGEQFTPLDLDLGQGCAVVTGANMGGKTVSLRSTVLALLLCQCGFFVFADCAVLPLFHRVDLILADSGPGAGGLSSFGKEVHALDAFLRASGGSFFFLALDEFARGTNPQEGAALARALVQYLGQLSCMALLTTHYDGVSDAADTHYQVAGLVREIAGDEGDDPRRRIARRMDYRLLPAPPGAPCPRDALRVCRLLQLDPGLMELFAKSGE